MGSGWLKLRRQVARPGVDRCPIPHVTGGQLVEGAGRQPSKQTVGEAQLGRVLLAAKQFMRNWFEPGIVGQLLLKLGAHPRPLLLVGLRWPKREQEHPPLLEGFPMPPAWYALLAAFFRQDPVARAAR